MTSRVRCSGFRLHLDAGCTEGAITLAELSKAAQMRRKAAEGYTIGQVARLFHVSYHHAHGAIRNHAGARDTYVEPGGRAADVQGDPTLMSDEQLFDMWNNEGNARKFAIMRTEASKELDERYPDESWMQKAEEYKKARR